MTAPSLSGSFLYRSFYNGPIETDDGKVTGSPVLANPWTPVGTLDVTSDADTGDVVGKLAFSPTVVLDISGKTLPATSSQPASFELKGEGVGSVYQIRGWFVPDSDHFVGSVLCLAGDLARLPVGTVGPFILFPKP